MHEPNLYQLFKYIVFINLTKKYKHESIVIDKGDYYCEGIKNWRSNLECIKDVFHDMMESGKTDSRKPCIEWYRSDDEMLCLIKAK